MSGPNKFSKGLSLFLGLFEFVAVSQFWIKGPEEDHVARLFVSNNATRVLYAGFICFLGLQRLTYATGNGGVIPWICLCLTHVIETVVFYVLTLEAESLRNKEAILSFLFSTIQLEKGKNHFILLILVPIIALSFIVAGPGGRTSEHNNKAKEK
jgi:hypothetical protein